MKIKNVDYKKETHEIVYFVKGELDGSDYNQGQLETIDSTVDKTVEAFGRLLNILAEKKLLTAGDITRIVSIYDYSDEAEFVDE